MPVTPIVSKEAAIAEGVRIFLNYGLVDEKDACQIERELGAHYDHIIATARYDGKKPSPSVAGALALRETLNQYIVVVSTFVDVERLLDIIMQDEMFHKEVEKMGPKAFARWLTDQLIK